MIHKMHKFMALLLNNISLKNKLMLSYFFLIIIPLGLLTFISYNQVSKFSEGQVIYSAKQGFEQTNSFLTYKFERVVDVLDIISLDADIHEILSKDVSTYEISTQLKDMEVLTRYLKSYQKNKDVYSVKLYVDENLLYSAEGVNLFSLSDCKDSQWYKNLLSNSGEITFSPSSEMDQSMDGSEKTISVIKGIRDFNNYSKLIGVLRLEVLETNLQNIIRKANTTKNGVTYLQNEEGVMVLSSDPKLSEKWKLTPDYCQFLSTQADNWSETQINGESLTVGCQNIQGTDFYFVSAIPYDEIISSSMAIRNQMYMLLAVLATVAYILAYFISSSSTRRISQVIRRMKKVQNGDLDVIIANSSRDEIGELVENFNYMVKRIDVLVKDQYKSGLEVKNAELKALQAQINPHFLYNTLDLINWTAIRNKVPEISSIVKSLAKFYKLSLSKGKDIVTFSDEITHVSLYVDIQNKRFDNKIRLEIDIEEQFYQYSILKILLQPIVENSILHGIMEKEDKSGTIIISGRLSGDMMIIKITDDGVGMPEDKVRTIFDECSKDSIHGFGIRNINNRIKLYYGEQYGLSYTSQIGKGTEVEIRLPALIQV